MAVALLVIGAVIAAVGLSMLVVSFNDARRAPKRGREVYEGDLSATKSTDIDVGKIIEEINKLLDKIEQRYRLGLVLVLIGAALMVAAFVLK